MDREKWEIPQGLGEGELKEKSAAPLLVSDVLHILNENVYKAILDRNSNILETIVRQQLSSGAQALAVNLGPGREIGHRTGWVVDTIQAIADVPMFFSANIQGHTEVLRKHGRAITINAVTANPGEINQALKVAQHYGCSVVALLVRSGENTAGIHNKIIWACEVLERVYAKGFPRDRLYFDPILACHHDPLAWRISRGWPDIGAALETISMVKQLDTDVKTIVALGNHPRAGGCGRSSMYTILADAGVDAVLLNSLDSSMSDHVNRISERVSYSSVT